MEEIISHIEIGNTYQTLLTNLPESEIQIFGDRHWEAELKPPLGSDARLTLDNSSLTVDLVVVGMGDMEAVDLDVLQNVHQQAAQEFDEVQLVENKLTEQGETSSGYTEFSGMDKQNGETVHMRVMVTFRGDQAIITTIKSEPQDWDVSLPALEELLANITFQ